MPPTRRTATWDGGGWPIKDPLARRLHLERGDIDIAEALPLDQIERLRRVPGVRVEDWPSLRVTYLYLNNRRPPLDDVRVRQALSYAVDYEAIIEGVMLGNAVQMRGPLPAGMWPHDPGVFQYRRDVERARALLEEAGWERGFTLRYLYTPIYPEWDQGKGPLSKILTLPLPLDSSSFLSP